MSGHVCVFMLIACVCVFPVSMKQDISVVSSDTAK